jgi:uncharacterized protein (TIGR03086 family)
MTQASATGEPAEAARLLERSIGYALGVAVAVTPDLLSRPTPCREWDLRMLLRHASESLAAISEGIQTGHVRIDAAAEDIDLAADPARAFRARARQLGATWTSLGHQRQIVEIAGCPLTASVMAAAAALEVAVHGWDISRACGQRRPIPPALAIDLLVTAAVLVPRAGRHPLFAAPVSVHGKACPSDRLAAFLGRSWPDPG